MFQSIDWSWVDRGLAVDAAGLIQGTTMLTDVTGEPAQCNVRLQAHADTTGTEHLTGEFRAAGDASVVTMHVVLQQIEASQVAQLSFSLEEQPTAHLEMSVALGAAALLAHWLALAVARRFGAGWILELEVPSGQADRVVVRLIEELTLAAELAADSVDAWACCLAPALPAS